MSVSRRGFLQGFGSGRDVHASSLMAARGHEEHVAELMQQGARQGSRGMGRPQVPPGMEAIRISSNENPLGPGKTAIDAILGKFPEANRYPFNSTPLDADLEILIAKQNNASAIVGASPTSRASASASAASSRAPSPCSV